MNDTNARFNRGEIYYIKSFPTMGHEQRSGRPAVIVSNNTNNANSGVLEVCYLTLKDKKKLPTHIFIDRGPCANSTILCEQITSVAVDRVGDFLCCLPEDLEEALNEALAISLDLNVSRSPLMPDSREAQLVSLKHENEHIYKELNSALKKLEEAEQMSKREGMYERMYNDLLDKLVNRGTK